jgi:hypothetical protein
MMHLIAFVVTASGVLEEPQEHSANTNRHTAAKDNTFFIFLLVLGVNN